MTTPRRITCTIPTLTSGGAERVLSTMVNHWAGQGRAVSVVTLAPQSEPPFYTMDEAVTRVGLGAMGAARTPLHAMASNVDRLRRLRRAIVSSRPDVVISFLDTMNVLTLLATRGTGIPVVVTEHTDPHLAEHHPVWARLRSLLYPRAARVVVLSESSKSFFPPRLRDRIQIVPNPIVVTAAQALPARTGRRRVAALGRFGPEKGFDTLISAFAAIAPDFADWDLVIWGDGPLRSELERHIANLDMTGRVLLPGRTSAPHDALRTADLYVLSSRREGFPMALAEAMACGLPAVAFDLPSGPRDIIREGIDGVLVPNGDQGALSAAMATLMRDERTRAAYAQRAPEVLDRFGVERIMRLWDDLFAEAIPSR
jgi:GalNAc-alpha-(1->4)-GalNAc-alpha-(1->3)-diNAcBac-PP-undecaprenol alpha-1,4-N-acetyl-D-galactosaminyltransferase